MGDAIELWIAEPRFRSYLDACQGDHDRAVGLYQWNVRISAAFFEDLHHLEVLLRNAIDMQFPDTPPAAEVPIAGLWLTDRNLMTERSLVLVDEAQQRIRNVGKPVTRDRLVGALSFGFWLALFSKHYEELWRKKTRLAFPNGDGKRLQVMKYLRPTHLFRNRIAHHDAIFSFDLDKRHEEMMDLAELIDSDAAAYIFRETRVPVLLRSKPG